ncbi:GIP [Symbiodinium sp. CCMP2592]|nr:GIP [Symbiodinium sp. CCMP2592]
MGQISEAVGAEVTLGSKEKIEGVMKVLHSDSQSALAVCQCAAGSWRTRHLRIRGSMIRELLEYPDWLAFYLDGKVMPADLGTKALAVDRFNVLVDRMRVQRKRHHGDSKGLAPGQVKQLMMVLCLTAMVEQGKAAEQEPRESFDYVFLGVCILAVIAVWEFVKGGCVWACRRFLGTGSSRAGTYASDRQALLEPPSDGRQALLETLKTSQPRRGAERRLFDRADSGSAIWREAQLCRLREEWWITIGSCTSLLELLLIANGKDERSWS